MERNQKSTLVLCGCVTAALIILLVLSLLAPHGEDIPRGNAFVTPGGRVQADSVINCVPFKRDILQALELACSEPFRKKAAAVKNPYGDGSSSERIYHILKTTLSTTQLDLKKSFYDIDFSV